MFCTPGLLQRSLAIGLRPYGGRPIAHLTGAPIPLAGLSADVAHSVRQRSVLALPQARLRVLGPAPPPAVAAVRARREEDESVVVDPTRLRSRLGRVREAAPESWLAALDARVVDALAHAGLELDLPAHTMLIEPGVRQQELYVVLEGACETLLGDGWVEQVGGGARFGEQGTDPWQFPPEGYGGRSPGPSPATAATSAIRSSTCSSWSRCSGPSSGRASPR
jgi:hypothetical protein